MKTFMLSLLTLAAACTAHAQGTFQFTAQMTGALPGQGTFSLTGDLFTYYVNIPYDWYMNRARIHGPAAPGMDAPIIFILGGTRCEVGAPGYAGGCSFRGNLTLSEPQISDLINGLWYVRAYANVYPDLSTRGQIVLVPEPATLILLACSAATLWIACHLMPQNQTTHSKPGA